MTLHTLEDILTRHLRLMLSMEHQAGDAFAWLETHLNHVMLGQCLASYYAQSQDRLSRLHDCFQLIGGEGVPLFCPTTASIMDQVRQAVEMPMSSTVRPVLLTATLRLFAQHQVMVTIQGCDWAERLGRAETVLLLQQGLAEQKCLAHQLHETAHAVEQSAPQAA